MERFRLHKQHRREKEAFLKKTRQAAATGGGAGAMKLLMSDKTAKLKPHKPAAAATTAAATTAPPPIKPLGSALAVELTRVDHNNRPHRWKDANAIVDEVKIKTRQKVLRDNEPVKAFPDRLRKKIFNVENSELEEEAKAGAASSLEAQHSSSSSSAHSNSCNSTNKPRTETDELLKIDQSQFPLHVFDSEEFETHSPQEWLAQGETGSSPYFFKGEWRWRKCAAQSYDAEKQKFLIQFQGSDKHKWVKRINLRFESETPELFQQRVDEAVRRRKEAKAQLRFDHFLTKQMAADLKAMSRHTLEQIHQRVVSGLPEQVALVDGQPAAAILRSLTDATIQSYMRSTVAEFGKIALPQHSYEKNRKRVGSTHYTCSAQLLSVLLRMYAGWEKTLQRLLLIQVDIPPAPPTPGTGTGAGVGVADAAAGGELSKQFPFRLLDFKALQTNRQNKAAEILLIDWRRSIVENIIDNPQDHYDFFMSDLAVYSSSKLKRIITGVETRMAARLRVIVTRSTAEWVGFVRKSTIASEPPTKEIAAVMVEPLEAIFASVLEVDSIDCDIMSLLALERHHLLDFEGDRTVVGECVDGKARAVEIRNVLVDSIVREARE